MPSPEREAGLLNYFAFIDQVTVPSPRYGDPTTFTIYFAGTNDGRVYKVARWRDNSKDRKFHSRLLDVIPATSPEPIRTMSISR